MELQIRGVSKTYANGVRALKDVTLTIPPDDAKARRIRVGGDPIAFEAIVGTSGNQIAVAPGALRRAWTEGGRRYFHYVTDVPHQQ
jgi:hypothetical protein